MTTATHLAGKGTAGPDQAQGELLDVRGVAALLACSPRTIYRLSDAGKMPGPLKIGTLSRWNRAAILAWIADGCKPYRTGKAVRT